MHFHVFGYKVYIFLSSEVHANKLTSYSKLIIFIGYENNSYCFVYYIQENIIFHFIHAIFDEKLFPKYTNFHVKEYKLYNKLLDKISPETESSVSDSSEKGRPAPIPIPHTLIPLIQSNPPTHSSLSSLSYKSTSLSPTPESKKPSQDWREWWCWLWLKYNLALNILCNLLCRYYKKVLNWGDLSIKLRYPLEKKIFMKNKNILPIFYRILYSSQERGFLTPTWLINTHQESQRIYQNTQCFSNKPLSRTVRVK